MQTMYQFIADGQGVGSVLGLTPRYERIFQDVAEVSDPFIRDFGNGKRHAYFVEGSAVSVLRELFKKKDFLGTVAGANPARAFARFADRYLSTDEIAQASDGLGSGDILSAVQYAQKRGLAVRTKDKKHHYGDVARSLQAQRGLSP